MDISVVTPSCRIDSLEMVKKCLNKQTFPKDRWEWLVGSTFEYKDCDHWVKDPGKKEGDFYSLNSTYNALIRQARGELVISLQDGIWIQPDTLGHFWELYQADKKSCVGAIGDQYGMVDDFFKPIVCTWRDPRRTTKHGEYYEIRPDDLEWSLCSVPKKALYEVGGFEEKFDIGAACSEKEVNIRMDRLGYKFFIDQGLEYRAVSEPRLFGEEKWNKAYLIACNLMEMYKKEIKEGNRLKLDFLDLTNV